MTNPLFLLNTRNENAPISYDEMKTGWKMQLPESVRRHALQSMRLQDGDELQLSNGEGLRIQAHVADGKQGTVEVDSFETEEAPKIRLALIQALAKNGHDEQAIDVATQIGVDEVIPWQADRSIARWKAGRTDKKWFQTLQSATEQSRRAWLPELGECVGSKGVVAICRRANVHGDLVIVLHQDATDSWIEVEELVKQTADKALEDGKTRTIYVVVGPEGGISDQEVEQFKDAGAHCCVMGHNILRASSAGPVALALLSRVVGRYL